MTFEISKRSLVMGAMAGVATLGVACSDKKSSVLEANKQLCRDYFQAILKNDTD